MKRTGIGCRILSALIYVLFVSLMCIVIVNKDNLHVDGFFSYGLSNQTYEDHIGMAPMEGKVYTPAESVWREYLTVQKGARFDYKNVWKNQEEDVHPPLYYLVLHTICSLFPNRFSIWFAALINILFAVLTLYVSGKIIRELGGSERNNFLFSVAFSLSAGILSSVALLRMYLMTMFWVALISLLFLKIYRTGGSVKKFAAIAGVCAAGVLTHYYFIIYLFFLCLVMGVYLLWNKRIKEIVAFIVSVAGAGIVSVCIFPGMVYHIFLENGDRGEESVQRLLHTSKAENLQRLKDYFGYLNYQLFGGLLPLILLFAVCVLILTFVIKKEKIQDKRVFPWCLLGIPCLCYYILVSRICVYTADRYIQPIYPIVLIVGIELILVCMEKLLKNSRIYLISSGLLLLILSANGLRICPWEYLYKEDGKVLKELEAYSDCDCLFIYDEHDKYNRVQQSYFEVRQYQSVVFVADADLSMLEDLKLEDKERLIVCIDYACNTENVLDAVQALNPGFTTAEKLGKAGLYATTWYLGE